MKIRQTLSSVQRKIIREIVQAERGDEPLSPYMRLIADMNAADTLREEYGIKVKPKSLAKIA